jgi:lyso-ornithine lipid O-acyltransferase
LSGARIVWRASRLILHLLLGLLLTPLVTRRQANGERRTDPLVTSWWHGRVARILKLEITHSGQTPQPPALIVSNHVSWLDIIVLGHLTPTCFLSKSEVRGWPVIGWLAARAGTLFIKRGGGQAASIGEAIGGRLQHDGLLTLFPEGTTTDGRDVRPFFSRLFAASIDTGTPIVPTSIRYHIDGHFDAVAPYIDDQTLGANMLGLMRRPRNQVHVHFGTPIECANVDRKTLAETARKAIVSSLHRPLKTTHADRPAARSNAC